MQALFLILLSLFAQSEILELDYDAFDQTDSGWRSLAYEEQYLDAAQLIDRYVDANRNDLLPSELRLLNFHSGQMYAFTGDCPKAVERFETSYTSWLVDLETSTLPAHWNAYVDATIAFLEGDLDTLLRQRAVMRERFGVGGDSRTVVDKLIENFGKPYSEAYGD